MSLEEFQYLNPQHDKPVILAAGTPQVLLPYDHANRFLRELPRHSGPLASWTAWVAPKTIKPAEAARLVGMSEARLREVNRIPDRMLVKAGSTLLVPRREHSGTDVAEHLAHNAVDDLGARRSAAAPCHLQGGAQGRQRGGRGAPLSGERGAGGAVEHGRHPVDVQAGPADRGHAAVPAEGACRSARPQGAAQAQRRNPRRAAAPLRPRRDSRACPIPRRRGAAGRRWWWRESRNSAARSASGKPRR